MRISYSLTKDSGAETGATIHVCRDPKEAIADADVVYSDVWASMGFEAEQKERELAFKNYQVNEELVKYAKRDYLVHALPACTPRRRSERRCYRWQALDYFRSSGEPSARAKSDYGSNHVANSSHSAQAAAVIRQ